MDHDLIDALREQVPYDLVLHAGVRERAAHHGHPLLRYVQEVPQQQQAVVDAVAVSEVEVLLFDDVPHVIHDRLGAPAVGEGLLPGGQQVAQLENHVPAGVGPRHVLHGQQAFHGHGQVDQYLDRDVYDLGGLGDFLGVVPDVDEERYQVVPYVLSEADRSPERAQGFVFESQFSQNFFQVVWSDLN